MPADIHALGRAASERARVAAIAAGDRCPAMVAALAHIDAAFGMASVHDRFKRRVRRLMRKGPCDVEVRARFRKRVELLRPDTLETAMVWVETWHSAERKRVRGPYFRGTLLDLQVLAELRLIMRFMRRHLADDAADIADEVLEPMPRLALVREAAE